MKINYGRFRIIIIVFRMVRLLSLILRIVNNFIEIYIVDVFKKSFFVFKLLVIYVDLLLYYEVYIFSIFWWILK